MGSCLLIRTVMLQPFYKVSAAATAGTFSIEGGAEKARGVKGLMDKKNSFIGRCGRAYFEEYVAAVKGIMTILRAANERLGEEKGRYTRLEAFATMLTEALDVDEKCRIVIEYDPADSKVAVYREELNGSVCTLSEYPQNQ